VAGAAGTLWSDEAAAQTAKEEKEREKPRRARHDHRHRLCSGRVAQLSDHAAGPQREHPERYQRQGLCQARPGGQLGAGGALVQKVQGGTIQARSTRCRTSRRSRRAVDLINMPYFCGESALHQPGDVRRLEAEVHPKVEASKGFKPLFYVVIDPRVVAVRKGGKPVMTPGRHVAA
jgi:hypothetical protein